MKGLIQLFLGAQQSGKTICPAIVFDYIGRMLISIVLFFRLNILIPRSIFCFLLVEKERKLLHVLLVLVRTFLHRLMEPIDTDILWTIFWFCQIYAILAIGIFVLFVWLELESLWVSQLLFSFWRFGQHFLPHNISWLFNPLRSVFFRFGSAGSTRANARFLRC